MDILGEDKNKNKNDKEIKEIDEAEIFGDVKAENEDENSDEPAKDFDSEIESESESEPAFDAVVLNFNKRQGQFKIILHILAFAVPFILMLVAFASAKMSPFGPKQIMIVDSWHQYFPFLKEFQLKLLDVIRGNSSLSTFMYSWNIGSGVNFLALMSYYASTPLYLFSVFFPTEYLREFMMIITIVKISLAGLFFSIYLRGVYKKCDFATVGFSVLYALSAYAVGYYWCLMWLEGMAMLPLIVLGLHNLLDKGKYRLYVVSLALTAISNYYVAFLVCVFIAFYYIALYFSKSRTVPEATPLKKIFTCVKKTLCTVAFSGLGVGLAGFILLPTYRATQLIANFTPSAMNSLTSEHTLLETFTNLLTNTTPAIRSGLPNIACGLLTVLFALLYFANPKIKLREKIADGTMIMFLALSFIVSYLNYYWHAMHLPNEIPYRQAFVFSFVLLTMAYKAFSEIDAMHTKTIGIIGASLFTYLIFAEHLFKGGGRFDFKIFYVNIALLGVYMGIVMLYKHKKITMRYFALFLMFVMFSEGAISAVKGVTTAGSTDRDHYIPAFDEVQSAVEYTKTNNEELFYRLELTRYDDNSKHRGWWTCNDPALYEYRGISQFSSMANSNFTKMLETLGISASPIANRYLYVPATPVFNMMMSLKYIMTRNDTIDSVAFDEISDNGLDNNTIILYENKYWLPLGFMVDDKIWDWDRSGSNIFLTQNDFIKTAVAGDTSGHVFKSIEPTERNSVNIDEVKIEYGVYNYKTIDTSKKGEINHTYVNDKKQQVFLYIKSSRIDKATVRVNKGKVYSYETRRGVTVDCGYLFEGDVINVSLETEVGDSGTLNIFAAGFDEDVFKYNYEKLKTQGLEITSFEDTNIKGRISVERDGVLFTSIPYEKGWHAKVDGVKTEIISIDDAFVTLELDKGEHEIEFYYVTDGLAMGAMISGGCLLILIGLYIFEKKFAVAFTDFITDFLAKKREDKDDEYDEDDDEDDEDYEDDEEE